MGETTMDSESGLLIAALRHANQVSMTLNRIGEEVSRLLGDAADDPKYDELHALLRRRFLEDSGVPLFMAADQLCLALPADLRGEIESDA
jgi:hypothetical protein